MSRFKDHVEVKNKYLTFWAGPCLITMKGTIAHGVGTREVYMHFTSEDLQEFARLAAYVVAEPNKEHHGHALWHWENSEREYPCEQCSPVVHETADKWASRVDKAPRLPRAAPSEAVPVEAGRTGNEPDYEGEDHGND